MSSSFVVELDTTPPASPRLAIEGGVLSTGNRVVSVAIGTADADATEMKLWGDVDPTENSLIQVNEDASTWQLFRPDPIVVLAAGSGSKRISARLRDDVYNATAVFGSSVLYDPSFPVVSITQGIDRSRISKVPPFDTATFAFASNLAFDQAEVRVVPTSNSPHTSGLLLDAVPATPANQEVSVTLSGVALETASPGDTTKVIKVFVHTPDGLWST